MFSYSKVFIDPRPEALIFFLDQDFEQINFSTINIIQNYGVSI